MPRPEQVEVSVAFGKRTPARDLGEALGAGEMPTSLRSGGFGVDAARALDQMPELLGQEGLSLVARGAGMPRTRDGPLVR